MKDVIIVGGGLKGMLTALFLHDAGLNVMILDQSELGRESSWASGGLLAPLYPWQADPAITALARYSQQHYPDLCARLLAETCIDPQWVKSGLLLTEMEELATAQDWAQNNACQLEHLRSSQEVHDCEPQLAGHIEQGIFLPEIGQVRSPRLSAALRASIRQRPILVSEHQPVERLQIENGQISGVWIKETLFKASKVVLATGAWTAHLHGLHDLPVRPRLAHSIMFRAPRGLVQRMLVKQGHYLIPRQDGRIVCGPVLEERGLEKQGSELATSLLRRMAGELLPVLQKLPVHNQWSSLLSATPRLPLAGEHPAIHGLYINAGHGTHGMATGLAASRLLADMILGKTGGIDPSPYRLPTTSG